MGFGLIGLRLICGIGVLAGLFRLCCRVRFVYMPPRCVLSRLVRLRFAVRVACLYGGFYVFLPAHCLNRLTIAKSGVRHRLHY
jgi:hypothetical protein